MASSNVWTQMIKNMQKLSEAIKSLENEFSAISKATDQALDIENRLCEHLYAVSGVDDAENPFKRVL